MGVCFQCKWKQQGFKKQYTRYFAQQTWLQFDAE